MDAKRAHSLGYAAERICDCLLSGLLSICRLGLDCDLHNMKSLNNFINMLMRIVTMCLKSRSRRHTNSPLMVAASALNAPTKC
jgi:hypothetical protein